MQLLAVQAADEARHIDVFTFRALRHSNELGRSPASERASLDTLMTELDFELTGDLM